MYKKHTLSLAVLSSLMALQPFVANAGALEEAFSEGEASVNARYRYEGVDDSVNKDASVFDLIICLLFLMLVV